MLKKQAPPTSINTKLTKSFKIAIIKTDYYIDLNQNLETACRETLMSYGVLKENIKTYTAPGSWEIPLITQRIAKTSTYDAIVAFGIIVKGDTYHFKMIANESARALMQLSLDYSIPVAIEVLAVNSMEQAKERASQNDNNKGVEGAMAVLKVLQTLYQIKNE